MSDASTAVEVKEPGGRTSEEAWFEEALERIRAPEALGDRRRRAWARYRELAMPTKRSEEWRYTDISDLDPTAYRPAAGAADGAESPEELPAPVREVLAR